MKILLFGCTGVGKITIGKLLSENIDFSFYDIDYVIKANYGTILDFLHFLTLYMKDIYQKQKLQKG